MANLIERFERWRKRLPTKTSFLVDLVMSEIVPLIENRGFVWHADYAGSDAGSVAASTIALQRRSGDKWPTIEIQFGKRKQPFFSLYFAELGPSCYGFSLAEHAWKPIPRLQANVVEGDHAFFLIRADRKNYIGNFGMPMPFQLTLNYRKKLKAEVDVCKSLIPQLLDLLDRGIPDNWSSKPHGKVSTYAYLLPSLRARP